MIWQDRTDRSIVVGCDQCPPARALVGSVAEAERWATQHLALVHPPKAPEVRRAVSASQARRRRATP